MFSASDIKQVPILQCLSAAQVERLASIAADLQVRKGEWLIREGDLPWFFVLIDGALTLFKEFGGLERRVNQYQPGDFFGETPILLGAPAFASVQGQAEISRVMRLDRLQFKELIDESDACSAAIMQMMSKRITMVSEYFRENDEVRVLIVGSQYDTDCRDIRTFLSMNRIPYEWIDRDKEPERVPSCMPPGHEGPSVVIDHNRCLGEAPTVGSVAAALGYVTEPRREDYDVVVIGAGPAGLAAGVYGASEGLSVLMVERAAAGGQAGTSSRIENYLGFPNGVSGEELSQRALKQAERFGAEIVLTRDVTNVEGLSDGRYCVELDGGTRVRSKTVILATGVEWRRLDAEDIDQFLGKGVLYGAARTEAPTVTGKDIFIVGAGNSAGQAAMFFSSYARSVTMLVRGKELHISMSQYLVDQIAGQNNISVETWTRVVSVGGTGHLETVCTVKQDEEPVTRNADALFVMIGADAKTDWLPATLQRDDRGYICTGRDVIDLPGWDNTRRAPYMLETNLPGVFCAGDVRHDSIKRVSSGVGEGSMAIAFVHQYLAMQEAGRSTSA